MGGASNDDSVLNTSGVAAGGTSGTGMDAVAVKRVAQFRDTLERAIGFDSWGQLVEATDEYNKVAKSVQAALADTSLVLTEEHNRFLQKVVAAVGMRTKACTDLTGANPPPSIEQMRLLVDALRDLPTHISEFPIQVTEIRKANPVVASAPAAAAEIPRASSTLKTAGSKTTSAVPNDSDGEEEESAVAVASHGSGSLKPKTKFPGQTNVVLKIEKIKLKEKETLIEPFVTISVKDVHGNDLCEPQDTPVTNRKDDYIHFDNDVYVQRSLEKLPPGCAIFLELKHYKPRKHKTSTKCYSFMELDELSNGSFPLEIYAKPTDFRRKKLHLLTEKPHYFYVTVVLEEN